MKKERRRIEQTLRNLRGRMLPPKFLMREIVEQELRRRHSQFVTWGRKNRK